MSRIRRSEIPACSVRAARWLLGRDLIRILPDGARLSGRIIETEAYRGIQDAASHAFGGRRSPRNESMYARRGTAYVYFTYGMHHCVNLVCGDVDVPEAVLIRAIEPMAGIERMIEMRTAARRARGGPVHVRDLGGGPGRLCSSLGIDRGLDGTDLVTGDALFLDHGGMGRKGKAAAAAIGSSARVGLSCAERWATAKLRFYLKDVMRLVRRA